MNGSHKTTPQKQKLPVIPCGVALVRRGRQFLISQRMANDTFPNLWEFPGGKKNPGETFEHCVAREALEELGIEVRVEKKIGEVRREHHQKIIWLNFFLCSELNGDGPRALECQAFLWVDVEELKNYQFPPANEKLIEQLVAEYGGSGR
jgi:mutator protein MutT